nr:hypothetical protein [uncultured bacterium]
MNPATFVKRRVLYGGPAPTAVASELVQLAKSLEADQARLGAMVGQAGDAERMLEQTVRSFATPNWGSPRFQCNK